MEHKIPTWDWAAKHPNFLSNIEAMMDIMAKELPEECRETIIRQIMMFARQEFTPNE